MLFLSTQTVQSAFRSLASVRLSSPNDLLYFLIMKACGFNSISYRNFGLLKDNGLEPASRLMSLFSPDEQTLDSGSLICPFAMKSWPKQVITEDLKKWVGSRLKNNVVGGGAQWRDVLDYNSDENTAKFKHNYVQTLSKNIFDTQTINMEALAVWSYRFTPFPDKHTIKEVCDGFVHSYKLDIDEIRAFFNQENAFDISFSDDMHNASEVRALIGNIPEPYCDSRPISYSSSEEYINNNFEYSLFKTDMCDSGEVTPELIAKVLETYKQVILEGPPGTSKSYYASAIAKSYDETVHVQFHPQYSYQSFVGGYVVDGESVVYRKGVMLRLLEHINPDRKYLLVIDELNRANVSQVFGEVIQCLDRTQSVCMESNGDSVEISIPNNVHILATLNTADRTLGRIDYAVKRRFAVIHCSSNPRLLIDLCPSNGFISLSDFLSKINGNLVKATGNKELEIGHALFLDDSVKVNDKYLWDFESFRLLYDYKILPLIYDFCSQNAAMVEDVVGIQLSHALAADLFPAAVCDFVGVPHD